MTDEGIPRRNFLKATAGTALAFGTGVPAAAQTSTLAPPSPSLSISSARPADLILKNAKVITVDSGFTIAQAVAIGGGRILTVGPDAAMAAHTAPWTRVLDLNVASVGL